MSALGHALVSRTVTRSLITKLTDTVVLTADVLLAHAVVNLNEPLIEFLLSHGVPLTLMHFRIMLKVGFDLKHQISQVLINLHAHRLATLFLRQCSAPSRKVVRSDSLLTQRTRSLL